MGIVSCNEKLLSLVALYASQESIPQVIKAVNASIDGVRAKDAEAFKVPANFNPSNDSPLGERFKAEKGDTTNVAIREDGIVDWVKSIPSIVEVAKDEKHPDREEAAKSLAFFKRFAATLDWRALL